jgi:hypothetical protein
MKVGAAVRWPMEAISAGLRAWASATEAAVPSAAASVKALRYRSARCAARSERAALTDASAACVFQL